MRTPAKSQAARKNGQKGGRPRNPTIRPRLLAQLVLDLRGENRAFARASTGLAEYYLASTSPGGRQ